MFGIIGWIVFGLVVGAIAKLVMPGRDPGGFIVTILLGIVGAVFGGWIGRTMGMYGPNEPAGFVMALIGAVVVLAIYRMAIGRRRVV
ncbi:MAG TPA: GlsB/YeaQ/YmgE family stress response membrane protein [Vicinamibacterales bacterium]|nr:GlsB/YeaQ/YmgE family stress response membrane protein [Vicinamibacterales bacterium]